MEIGIEPTVRHGADLGLIPVLPRDACGAGNPDAARAAWRPIEFMGDALLCDTDAYAPACRRAAIAEAYRSRSDVQSPFSRLALWQISAAFSVWRDHVPVPAIGRFIRACRRHGHRCHCRTAQSRW